MKRCSHCKQIKDFEFFSNNKTSQDGKHHACKQCKADEQKRRHARAKIEIFERYCKNGDIKCQCSGCDTTDLRFLTVDHINNDGAEHRRKIGAGICSLYWWLKKNHFPDGFQILCYNCNGARARNNGVCPHLDC